MTDDLGTSSICSIATEQVINTCTIDELGHSEDDVKTKPLAFHDSGTDLDATFFSAQELLMCSQSTLNSEVNTKVDIEVNKNELPEHSQSNLTSQQNTTSRQKLLVVFNRKIQLEGFWNFDLAQLGKLHYVVREDGTREPMTLQYELAREKRIQRQVFDRWRRYKPTPEIDLNTSANAHAHDVKVTLSEELTTAKYGPVYLLPWWCIFFPWLLVVLISVTCATFTIFYSLDFGSQKSKQWLHSLLISLFTDIFYNQPLTILFIACFFTFISKASEMEQTELNVDSKQDLYSSSDEDLRRIETERQAISMLRLDSIYRPPSQVNSH